MTPKHGSPKQGGGSGGSTAEEREAMRDRVREAKAGRKGEGSGEGAVLEKITAMPEPDRALALRIHAIIREHAPELTPRLWYGMPAYSREGNVVCFFQGGYKFKARYATLGFSDKARLDEGAMWPTSFALTALTPATEQTIVALVARAAAKAR
ncbi:MAG TPA: DUF1801 domain-containing protein [Gemmatimonadales bacterium]|nr:DUF1801 domain-containing protein [Gemmatimonadales bacterium]